MFRLIERVLSDEEIGKLVKGIALTPNITGYSFWEWKQMGKVWVAEEEHGKMMGICLCHSLGREGCILDVLFVLEEFRGLGVGKGLFEHLINLAFSNQRFVYTASREQVVIRMMEKMDFLLFNTLYKLPESYRQYEWALAWYHFRWMVSIYRMSEISRKQKVYNCNEPFIYGIKCYRADGEQPSQR